MKDLFFLKKVIKRNEMNRLLYLNPYWVATGKDSLKLVEMQLGEVPMQCGIQGGAHNKAPIKRQPRTSAMVRRRWLERDSGNG